MTNEQAIEALKQSIKYRERLLSTPGNTISSSLEGDLEFDRVCLQALRGWQALQYLTSARSVSFQYDSFGKMCQCWVRHKDFAYMCEALDPLSAVLQAFQKTKSTPATAAIAAESEK